MISHDRAQELLSERLDGPLALSDARALQEHLAACSHCRALADAFGGLATELRGLPALPPSPAVSRAVLEHVHSRRPAWNWLRTGLGAAGSPAVAVASGLALTAALAGTIYLATSDRITTSDDGRTPVSAIAVSPDETPSPTPPPPTIAAPTEEPEPTERPEPTATSTPWTIALATATATPTRTVNAVVTVTPEPAENPTQVPVAAPTEAPDLAMVTEPTAESAAPTSTPEPAIRPAASEAPTAVAVEGVIEAAQVVEPEDGGEGGAIDIADAPPEPGPTEEPAIAMAGLEESAGDPVAAAPDAIDAAAEAPLADEAMATQEAAAITIEPPPVEPIDPTDAAPIDEAVFDQPEALPEPTQPPIVAAEDPNAGVVSGQPASSELEPEPTLAPEDDPAIAARALEPGVDESGVPIEPAADAVDQAATEIPPTEVPAAPPDDDIAAAAVIGAGDPGPNPIVSPSGAALTTTASDDGSVTIAVPDASGAPVAFDPTDEPHSDTPVGWAGGNAYYQRSYPDGRLELRAGSPGAGGWVIWSGAPGIFGPGIGQARLTAGGDRIAFTSGGVLYVAPTGDPNAASPVAVGNVVGFDWAPAGDRLAVSDGYAISIFGPFGEGPLISVGNQGGIPIGTVDWREDGIAVGRYDTGEMVLIPI